MLYGVLQGKKPLLYSKKWATKINLINLTQWYSQTKNAALKYSISKVWFQNYCWKLLEHGHITKSKHVQLKLLMRHKPISTMLRRRSANSKRAWEHRSFYSPINMESVRVIMVNQNGQWTKGLAMLKSHWIRQAKRNSNSRGTAESGFKFIL